MLKVNIYLQNMSIKRVFLLFFCVQCAARLPASLIMHAPITDLHEQWHFDFNWLNIVIKIFLVTAEWIKGIVVVVIVWLLDLQLPMQSVLITTNVVNSHLAHVEVYSIQHYVIKFVSDLRQVGGFFWVLQFPPSIKRTATI